jgi:hypothetical protein
VKVALAGCPFVVSPGGGLLPDERRGLERLARGGRPSIDGLAPLLLELVNGPPWPEAELDRFGEGPAEVSAAGTGFASLTGGSRPRSTWPRPRPRLPSSAHGGAVEIVLRVALAARLPSLGGLPLHAAGLVLDGRGVAFFGPSGAGKTTLSSRAAFPVISDELVAVIVDPPALRATGFWGEMDGTPPPPDDIPLAALVELAKGPSFRLSRLAPPLPLRRLLGVLMVPPHPALWAQAMTLAGRAAKAVPVYRMEWSPSEPPWPQLRAALSLG